MSDAEKRSVNTDALATLGTIIGEGEKRDAIHIAVEPTTAAQKLHPGQDVGVDGTSNNPVGIVDPFLRHAVMPGERFWLLIYPRQISSLRHVWSHPAFADEAAAVPSAQEYRIAVAPHMKRTSEQWLRDWCSTNDCPSYDIVMEAIEGGESGGDEDQGWWKDGEYIGFRGRDAHATIPEVFWDHVENVLGRKVAVRYAYFSCSC